MHEPSWGTGAWCKLCASLKALLGCFCPALTLRGILHFFWPLGVILCLRESCADQVHSTWLGEQGTGRCFLHVAEVICSCMLLRIGYMVSHGGFRPLYSILMGQGGMGPGGVRHLA